MERFFILDKFNTWYDWRLYLTAKDIPDPEPNTNYVKLDGMNGSLDLSEALTGEVTYADRTISATFWTDNGSRAEREQLLRTISAALHGKKVKIIEPDDPENYLYGRIKIKSRKNLRPYAEFTIEATCDPWRYSLEESNRRVVVNGDTVDVAICNNGVKTLNPVITVTGSVKITHNGTTTELKAGSYKISDLKLYQGSNLVRVSGYGSATFVYREATL